MGLPGPDSNLTQNIQKTNIKKSLSFEVLS